MQRVKLTRDDSLALEYGVGGSKGGSEENGDEETHDVGV